LSTQPHRCKSGKHRIAGAERTATFVSNVACDLGGCSLIGKFDFECLAVSDIILVRPEMTTRL